MVGKHTLTHHAKYDQNHLLGLVKLCLILWFKFIIFEGSEEFDLQSTLVIMIDWTSDLLCTQMLYRVFSLKFKNMFGAIINSNYSFS